MKLNDFLMKHQVWVIAAFIFVVDISFKLFFFSDTPLWYDEVYTVQTALLSLENIQYSCMQDISAPFYYYVVHYWIQVFGIDEFSLRFLSVLFNSLAIVVLFLFTHQHFNFKAALIAVVLFFTSNSLFYYAQEVRVYSFLVFVAIASSWSFYELVFTKRWWSIFILALFNYCGVLSHYLFILVPFVQLVVVVLLCNRKKLLLFGASGVISLFMMRAWLERMFEVFTSGGTTSFQSYPSSKLLLELLNGGWSISLMMVVAVIGLYFLFYKNKGFDEATIFKTLYLVLCSFVILKITHLAGKTSSVYVPRYLLFVLPSIFMLVGYLYSQIPKNKFLDIGVMSLFILTGFLNMNLVISKGMDYQKLVEKIDEIKTERTLIIIQNRGMVNTFMYYYNRDLFKNINKISDDLFLENIVLADNVEDIEQIDFSAYNTVCLSQTYQEFTDPSKSVESLLDSKFMSDSLISSIEGVQLHIYTTNKEYNSSNKMISELGESIQIQNMINNIKSNKEWYEQIVRKSLEWGISVDSVLKKDAVYILEQQKTSSGN